MTAACTLHDCYDHLDLVVLCRRGDHLEVIIFQMSSSSGPGLASKGNTATSSELHSNRRRAEARQMQCIAGGRWAMRNPKREATSKSAPVVLAGAGARV